MPSVAVRSYTVATDALTVNGLLELGIFSNFNLPPDTTIRGSGTIRYVSQWAQLGVSTGTITIDNGMTIVSPFGNGLYYGTSNIGRIGSSSPSLVNRGVFDVTGGLVVSGSTIDNQGTFHVHDRGQLTIDTNFSLSTIGNLINDGGEFVISKTLDNVGQTLQVNHPRGWVLAGGKVNGGTVATTGPGYLYVPYVNTGTLNNVTLNGDVHVNGNLFITGFFGGSGTIKILNPEAIEGSGVIHVDAVPPGVTIRGGQSASFADPTKARIFASSKRRNHSRRAICLWWHRNPTSRTAADEQRQTGSQRRRNVAR